MRYLVILSVTLLLVSVFAVVHADNCSPCYCTSKVARCHNLNLKSVPDTDTLPTDIPQLDITDPTITSLKDNQFGCFKKLQSIYVVNSKLNNEIHEHAFKNMKNVSEISLDNNEIEALPTNLFTNTPNLAKLYLYHNKLSVLQKNLFSHLKSLKLVSLHSNKITIIEENCFVNVPLLIDLYLHQNILKSLSLSTIILNNLHILTLNNNQWYCNKSLCEVMTATVSRKLSGAFSITCTTPANLQDKSWIEVQQDLCKTVSCSPCTCLDNSTVAKCVAPLQLTRVPHTLPEYVTILHITDQKLTILEENQFTYLNLLAELYLERNHIHVIKPKAFYNLKNLALLTLTDNSISQLHNDTFLFTPNLTKLWLNKNNLTVLHEFMFSNLPSLQELDISHNKLNFINDNCFINVSSLHTINLSFNNLQRLQLSIIDDSSSLKNVYLNDNPWQCDESLCEVMNAAVSGRIWTGDNDSTCAAPHKLKGKRWQQIYEYFQPRITSNVSSIQEGQDITLQCQYCFVSNVMWTFNGIKLSRNIQQISSTSLVSTLTAKNARKEEQGYYVCHVVDCLRCEDAWLYVKVSGKHQQDRVDTEEVFHIIANSSSSNTRRGVILLSYAILQDEGKENNNEIPNYKEGFNLTVSESTTMVFILCTIYINYIIINF